MLKEDHNEIRRKLLISNPNPPPKEETYRQQRQHQKPGNHAATAPYQSINLTRYFPMVKAAWRRFSCSSRRESVDLKAAIECLWVAVLAAVASFCVGPKLLVQQRPTPLSSCISSNFLVTVERSQILVAAVVNYKLDRNHRPHHCHLVVEER